MKALTAVSLSIVLVGCAGSSGSLTQRHNLTTREYIATSDDAWTAARDYLRKISNDGHVVEDRPGNFMTVRVARSLLDRIAVNLGSGSITTEVWIEPGSRPDTVFVTFVRPDIDDEPSIHRDFRTALQEKLGGRNVIPTPSRQ